MCVPTSAKPGWLELIKNMQGYYNSFFGWTLEIKVRETQNAASGKFPVSMATQGHSHKLPGKGTELKLQPGILKGAISGGRDVPWKGFQPDLSNIFFWVLPILSFTYFSWILWFMLELYI